jgi:hypothetical protein
VPATRACQSILDREPAAVIGPLTSASAIGCGQPPARTCPSWCQRPNEQPAWATMCRLSPSLRRTNESHWFTVETLGLCSHLVALPMTISAPPGGAYRQAVEEAARSEEAFYAPGIPDRAFGLQGEPRHVVRYAAARPKEEA